MILSRHHDPVGQWHFLSGRKARRWVTLLEQSCKVLGRQGLPQPERLVVRGLDTTGERETRELPWPGLEHLEETVEGTALDVDEVEVAGRGWVFAADGSQATGTDIVTLHLHEPSWPSVWVRTWCDAWLPWNLHGRPQTEVGRRNAPRLVAALEEMEKVLEMRGEAAGPLKFARMEGFRLLPLGDGTDFSGKVKVVADIPSTFPWNTLLLNPPADLRFRHDVGLPHAPNARSGRHLLTLSPDGTAHLQHWQGGQEREWTAQFSPEILRRILQILAEVQFPDLPPARVMAGPSFRIVEVETADRKARATLSRIHAEKNEPYRELCEWVDSLMVAMRGEPLPGYLSRRNVS